LLSGCENSIKSTCLDSVTPDKRGRTLRLVVSNNPYAIFEALFYYVINQFGLVVKDLNCTGVKSQFVAENLYKVRQLLLTFASTSTLIKIAVQWLKLILFFLTVTRVALP
jgi:hypothetical protein